MLSGVVAVDAAGPAIWKRDMGEAGGNVIGAGIDTASEGTTEKGSMKLDPSPFPNRRAPESTANARTPKRQNAKK